VWVIDLVTGADRLESFGGGLADVRWLPGSGDLSVVLDPAGGEIASEVVIVDRDSGARDVIHVPNCASSLEVAPDGRTALLAPTFCQADPVSVIDLETRTFRKNLPGFGPVAYSPDGAYAVAFGRQADLLQVAGIHTDTLYSLLFIDMDTMQLDVVELGSDLPVYSVTPDGEVVLLYSNWQSDYYDGITIVDFATRALRQTVGPIVELSEYVATEDGALVYLIDGGLFRLDVASGEIEFVTLDCAELAAAGKCTPSTVNSLPGTDWLVLGFVPEPVFALFDAVEAEVKRVFSVSTQGVRDLAKK
jgi:hypothetical protein